MISKYIKSSTAKEIGEEEIILEIVINKKAIITDLQKDLEYLVYVVQEFTEKMATIAKVVMEGLADEQRNKKNGISRKKGLRKGTEESA